MMTYLAVTGSILALLSSVTTLFLLFRILVVLRAFPDEIHERARAAIMAFLTPPEKDEPSPLAVYTDQAAMLLAARLMQQLKTGMAGVSSGDARTQDAEGLQRLAAVSKSPWLPLLAGLLPKRLRNAILANPQFAEQLRFPEGNNGHGGQTPSVHDRLTRQGG